MTNDKIISKATGRGTFSQGQTTASMVLLALWSMTVAGMYLSGINIYIVAIAMAISGVIVGTIVIKIILDKVVFNRVLTYIRFRKRERSGKTNINTYVLPIKQLQKSVPIECVHENGLIQYTGNEYGVLFRYDPADVPTNKRDVFIAQITRLINSVGIGVKVSFHAYDLHERANPLKEQLREQINKGDASPAQKTHLLSMYESVTATQDRIADRYLMNVNLGTFKTLEGAEKAYTATMPGMRKSMQERGIYTTQAVTAGEVAMWLREYMTQEEVA